MITLSSFKNWWFYSRQACYIKYVVHSFSIHTSHPIHYSHLTYFIHSIHLYHFSRFINCILSAISYSSFIFNHYTNSAVDVSSTRITYSSYLTYTYILCLLSWWYSQVSDTWFTKASIIGGKYPIHSQKKIHGGLKNYDKWMFSEELNELIISELPSDFQNINMCTSLAKLII